MMIALLAAAASTACDESADERTIVVTAEQEQAMCGVLSAATSTSPVPKQANEDLASAPSLNAQGIKQPIALNDFEGEKGGYVALTIDPANETPVFVLLDKAVPFEVIHGDGSAVGFFEEGGESELCDEAKGRYSWFVEDSANYLEFGPTDIATFNIVIDIVD